MKKSIIALAVAGAMVAPLAAQADATLYGRLSVELLDTDGQDLNLGDEIGGRIGIKGDVDLGLEGTKGLFHQEWQSRTVGGELGGSRLSYIGAAGGWGKLTLGRQYMPHWSLNTNTYVSRNPNAAEVGFLGNSFFKRVNNVARYETPKLGNFKITGAAILNGQDESGANEDIDAYNLLVQYKANGLSVAASYAEAQQDGAIDAGSSGTGLAGTTLTDDLEIFGVSVNYKIGNFTLLARYEDGEFGTRELESTQLGGFYKIGNTKLKASWNEIEDETGADGDSVVLELAHTLGKGEVYVGYHNLNDLSRTAGGFNSITVGNGVTSDNDTTYVGYLVHF